MLIDTNIFLELAMGQKRAKECADLIAAIDLCALSEDIHISRFSLTAIEAMIGNTDFLRELLLLIYEGKIEVADFSIEDDLMVNNIKQDLGLDFDDSVQFIAANRLATYIVSFDKHFDKTALERKTPEDILNTLS